MGKNLSVLGSEITTRLLFSNDAQTPLGRVTQGGFISNSGGVREPRVLNSCALVYLLDGAGRYADALGRNQRVQAGDLLVLFPELAHTYGIEPGDHWSELYYVFDGPAFDMLRERGLLNPSRAVLRLLPIETWLPRLQQAMPQAASATLAERLIDLSRFIQLVTEISAVDADFADSAVPAWIAEACRLLGEQPQSNLQPEEVAATRGVPYETFRKRFTRHVGVAPAHYRSIRRIDAACALLHTTTLTVAAIAAQLGYADEFHFSRRFKQITGVTPRAFRRRLPG